MILHFFSHTSWECEDWICRCIKSLVDKALVWQESLQLGLLELLIRSLSFHEVGIDGNLLLEVLKEIVDSLSLGALIGELRMLLRIVKSDLGDDG